MRAPPTATGSGELLEGEQVRRQSRRVEHDEITAAVPLVPRAGEEIVHDVGTGGVDAESGRGRDPPTLTARLRGRG
jgi:hypothetical protein